MTTCITEKATQKEPSKAYQLVGRQKERTKIKVGHYEIGGEKVAIIAGPCSVESNEQLLSAALAVKEAGATILRGGAFKPRTSPYDFQGLGLPALKMLAEARKITSLPIATEVVDSEDVDLVAEYADILQIGSRNMSAFRLLQKAAKTGKPIILKRGFQATIKEWLLSAEYILAQGNENVILCERGIRTFDSEFTRNTLDLGAVSVLMKETHLPIIVDPSHAAGRADLIYPMSLGALAMGAHGLMIEVHPNPNKALCDGKQSLTPSQFKEVIEGIKPLLATQKRSI